MEGVIIHAGPTGEPAPAIVCHGAGAFERTLRELGEPLTAVEPAEGEEEPQAATV